MKAGSTHPLKLFYCYAREDRAIRDELDIHLSGLKRQNRITSWYDREVSPGKEWEKEIEIQLETAHIILLLVSPDFMASDYCYSIEMHQALKRHKAGAARVIPIIVRPVDWEEAPFSMLQVLPMNAVPVTRWDNRDDAFKDVAKGIRRTVTELQALLLPKKHLQQEVTVPPNATSYTIIEGATKNLRKLSFQERSELVERLLACSSIRHSGSRETILKQLPDHISDTIERNSTSRSDIFNIVDKCLEYSDGLQKLIDVIRFFEGTSLPMQRLLEFLSTIGVQEKADL